jgi:hypothetical protein
MSNTKSIVYSAWALAVLTSLFAFAVWQQSFLGGIRLTGYTVFPLLGLLAFSLMWTHYVVGTLRRMADVPKKNLQSYKQITNWIVLFCILLHPGLLILALWRDGMGLPPDSYLNNYVAPDGKLAVMLGSISLIIFLSFEFKKKFGQKAWWKFVEYGQIIAMVAIFFHALQLGGELDVLWYRAVWLFYGITFVGAVTYNYLFDKKGGNS